MLINIILITITIICLLIIITLKYSCKCNTLKNIDGMNNSIPLYLDIPTKLFNIYFPYININYINNKIIKPYVKPNIKTTTSNEITTTSINISNIDLWIQTIPDYEIKIFDILTDKKYDNIYKAIFDIKPEYHKLYNIFYAYMLNRKNSTLIKETDVQNKYIIKKLFNDIDNLYLIPFTETINNVNNLPIITDYNMIDITCKKENKYIPCRIKIIPEPKNFQIIEDKYYQDIIDYYTSMIFVDILKLIPLNEQCNIIIPIEEARQQIFREKLQTTLINVSPPIETTTSRITTCNCGKF